MADLAALTITQLEELLKHHKTLYYQGRPEISDAEYDALEDELRHRSPQSYVLSLVGSASTSSAGKIKHQVKMLSLEKTYDLTELKTWMNGHAVVTTFKLDGVSGSLIYEHGKLVLAKTRGDGTYGEDITNKVLWMDSVPKTITSQNGDNLEVRGEFFCLEKDFFHLAQEMESLGLERPSSPRNIVAGLLGRKEGLALCRYISFRGYDYYNSTHPLATEIEKSAVIAALGFTAQPATLHHDFATVEKAVQEAQDFMAEGDYQIDGLVCSYNDLSLHQSLGATAHHPRFKMAFKFAGEVKDTTLEDIEWQVSRQGILTPVGIIAPIELSGATLTRVSLHNYGLVCEYHLKAGDQIKIIRSGEVIPKFLGVTHPSNRPFTVPASCPVCQAPLITEEIRLRCSNEHCPGRQQEDILNFIQKIGIEDLSSKRLAELIRLGLVRQITDLYHLTVDDFLKLEKFQQKLAQKLVDHIQQSKQVPLTIFLSALGLSGGAYQKCFKIVQAGFNSLEKFMQMTVEDLMQVESFAEKSAADFIASRENRRSLIEALAKLDFKLGRDPNLPSQTGPLPLAGQQLCITGTLSVPRQAIENQIRQAGGQASSSVSKKTAYLVANEPSSSSKYRKAQELGIKIITEQELQAIIQGKMQN